MVTPLLLVGLLAPVGVDEAVRIAVEADPGMRAAGLAVDEAEAGAEATLGALDLTVRSALSYRSSQQNVPGREAFTQDEMGLDTALVQPLVWGTRLELGVSARRVETNNPFGGCIFGVPLETCWATGVKLELVQPLWRDAGRTRNEAFYQEALAAGGVAQARRRAVAASLVEGVVLAYVELARAGAEAGIRDQALALAEEQLAATKARIAAGAAAPVDLPVVEQAVAEGRQAVFAARQARADRAAALATLLGREEPPVVSLPDEPPDPATLAASRAAAVESNAELAVLEAALAQQRAGLVRLDNATDPRLDLSASAAQNGVGEGFGDSVEAITETAVYGATLSFEFPFANRTAEGNLTQARLGLKRAEAERDARRREVGREAGEAWRAVRTAEGNVELAGVVLQTAERALEAEQGKFTHGLATNLDVLQVQQRLAEARLGVARARADRLIALARLRRLTGRLLERYGLTVR